MTLNGYKTILEKYNESIITASSLGEQIKILKYLYNYFKRITPDILEKEDSFYNILLNYIYDTEDMLENEYIVDIKPNFIKNKKFKKSLNENHEVIEYIVYHVRKKLLEKLQKDNFNNLKLEEYNLTNYCSIASDLVTDISNLLNLKNYEFKIEPGFIKDSYLYDGTGGHCFNIVELNNKYYLVDCTYSQFFIISKNIIDKLGIYKSNGCLSGIFMLKNNRRKDVALNILKKGYIEITPGVLKAYLDGFAISYRNGLYYENTNDFSYTTSYTDDDYINFLKGNDSQLEHENELVLGFQNKQLKNPNFRILN